jgi:hypothetical protein
MQGHQKVTLDGNSYFASLSPIKAVNLCLPGRDTNNVGRFNVCACANMCHIKQTEILNLADAKSRLMLIFIYRVEQAEVNLLVLTSFVWVSGYACRDTWHGTSFIQKRIGSGHAIAKLRQ